MLDALHVELPSCAPEIHSFGQEDDFWPPAHMETHFTVPKACMDDYLRGYGVDLAKPWSTWPSGGYGQQGNVVTTPTDPPFTDSVMKQFGLKLDPGRTYPIHRFTTSYGSQFEVLLDEQGGTTRAYMVTAWGGPHML